MASDGHFRRCCPLPFLVSSRRLVPVSLPRFSPLPGCGVVALAWAFSCGELGETARLRSFVFVSWDGWRRGWVAVSGGWRRRVVVLIFIGSLVPCPLGRGNICGLRVLSSSAVRGSGCRQGSPYLVARRRAVIAPLLASLPPRRPRPIPAPCVSFLPAPCLLRLFLLSSPLPRVLVWFLIAFLPVLSTSRAGRSLLAWRRRCGSRPVASFPSSRVPVLACPTADRPRSRSSSLPPLVSHRAPFVFSPRFSTSVGVERGGSFSLCLSLSPSCGRRNSVGGEVLLLGGRCRRLIVFGLWCRCLYI